MARPRFHRRRGATLALGTVAAGAGAYLAFAGYLGGDAVTRFAASGRPAPVAAMYLSGDAGLRMGMGPVTARALAAHGVPVIGFSSPVLFRFRRTRAEVQALVADMMRATMRATRRERVAVIGQSYGADVLQTGLAALPDALRRHVAGIVLVVPGRDVFFRADPSSLAYHGAPDSDGRAALKALTWAPLTCIYGLAETDSACPGQRGRNVTLVGMPGGHFLNRDSGGLVRQVLAAVQRDAGSAKAQSKG